MKSRSCPTPSRTTRRLATLLCAAALVAGCESFELTAVPGTGAPPKPTIDAIQPPAAFAGQRVEITGAHFEVAGERPSVSIGGLRAPLLDFSTDAEGASRAVVEVPVGLSRGTSEVAVETDGGEARKDGFEYLGLGHLRGQGEDGRATVASLPVGLGLGGDTLFAADPLLRRVIAITTQPYPLPPTIEFIGLEGDPMPHSVVGRDDGRLALVGWMSEAAESPVRRGLALVARCNGRWQQIANGTLGSDERLLYAVRSPSGEAFLAASAAGDVVRIPDPVVVCPPASAPLGAITPAPFAGDRLAKDATALSVLVSGGQQLVAIAFQRRVAVVELGQQGLPRLTPIASIDLPAATFITSVALVATPDGLRRIAALDASGRLFLADVDGARPPDSLFVPVPQPDLMAGMYPGLIADSGRIYVPGSRSVTVVRADGSIDGRIDLNRELRQLTGMLGNRFLIGLLEDGDLNREFTVLDGLATVEHSTFDVPFDLDSLAYVDEQSMVLAESAALNGILAAAPATGGSGFVLPMSGAGCDRTAGIASEGALVAKACRRGTEGHLFVASTDGEISRHLPLATSEVAGIAPWRGGFAVLERTALQLSDGVRLAAAVPLQDAQLPRLPEALRLAAGIVVGSPDDVARAFAAAPAAGKLFVPRHAEAGGDAVEVAAEVDVSGVALRRLEVVPGRDLARAATDAFPVSLSCSADGSVVAARLWASSPGPDASKVKDVGSFLAVFANGERPLAFMPGRLPEGSRAAVTSVAVAPDGTAVYAGTATGQLFVLERGSDGAWSTRLYAGFEQAPLSALVFSPGGDTLAAALQTRPGTLLTVR